MIVWVYFSVIDFMNYNWKENKHMEYETTNTSSPFDDAHRTLINDCPRFIIPIVNEVFHREHSKDETVMVLNNEFFITKQDGKQKERITDTNFLIGNMHYHLEVQSSADGSLMYRIFEYDSQIALQDSAISDNKLVVKFPNSAILYLRHNKNTPNHMEVEIHAPGAVCTYRIPVMKVQRYSVDEIFSKGLFFLIPFHIFAYEQDMEAYEKDSEKLSELLCVYEGIIERLDTCVSEHHINEYEKCMLIDMSKKVLEHLTRKYSRVKEKVGSIMGGKILDYEAKDILNQGRAEGRAEGDRQRLVFMVQKKHQRGDSVEKIADDLMEDIAVIERIIAEMNV